LSLYDSDRNAAALLISYLLDGHPRPFDAPETLQIRSGLMVQLLSRCEGPWRSDRPPFEFPESISKEIKLWPKDLRLLSPNPDAIDPASLASAKENLRAVSNPLGKILATCKFTEDEEGIFSLISLKDFPLTWRTFLAELELTRAVLAVRLFTRAEGKPPADLEALVSKRRLAEIPLDPFTGRPLGYSAESGVLWSAGPEGAAGAGEGWSRDARWPAESEVEASREEK
jgi:hypothetical protein